MMDPKWVDYYGRFARIYTEPEAQSGYVTSNNTTLDQSVFDSWIEYIQGYFGVSPDHYLLDVGCGSGVFLKRFARYTSHLFGVDPAAAQIENARSNCPAAHLRIGSAVDAGFGDIRFDRIICNSVFLCFPTISHARDAISHFLSISSNRAKIWIGDLPLPTAEMREDGEYRRTGLTTKLGTQHYPPKFMEELCEDLDVAGTYIKQVVNKASAAFRYDWLIEKKG
jgi:SAM-dependent methyltransferase